MRSRPRTDATQSEIVAALRSVGASVQSLASVGAGVPDLLVGLRGVTLLIECKDGSLPPSRRRLTPEQEAWHAAWSGAPVWVITSADEALERAAAAIAWPSAAAVRPSAAWQG